ncbi:unnamed protein product [Timema podura]|uniref:Uncharacterized protein n=1 Tax=Timema podura TaxID=61482 RepID=A0ABN7PIG1_TIMPD|nr:unnamed protein product [Timema podura]
MYSHFLEGEWKSIEEKTPQFTLLGFEPRHPVLLSLVYCESDGSIELELNPQTKLSLVNVLGKDQTTCVCLSDRLSLTETESELAESDPFPAVNNLDDVMLEYVPFESIRRLLGDHAGYLDSALQDHLDLECDLEQQFLELSNMDLLNQEHIDGDIRQQFLELSNLDNQREQF